MTTDISTAAATDITDTAAVKRPIEDLYTAWAAGDADGFVADYLDDATSILTSTFRQSKDEVRQAMAAGFDGPLKGSRVLDEVQSVRFLTDTTALVVSRSAILFAGEDTAPDDRWVIATWALVRRNGRWMIAAYHNCPA